MATIWKFRKGETMILGPDETIHATTDQVYGVDVKECSFCGEPHPAAYWQCLGQVVAVCGTCARKHLAKFVADAIAGEQADNPHTIQALQRGLQDFEREFWRAAALAIHRAAQVSREEEAAKTS